MALISIENLKYKYPNTDKLVLNDISIQINKGEFIGIIGKNGAGKSTLSQAIIGLVPQFYNGAYGGKVYVDGLLADEVPVSEMCERVGLIFQNPFTQLSGANDTVYGEVAFGLQNLGVDRSEMQSRVEKVLKQLDIWEYRDRNPFDLSGGQMQRVAIASILVMQPDVIILDEPTSQLDPQGTEEVFRVVDELAKSGKTIIMIEQKLEKMAKYCDRMVLMSEGKVVCFDTPEKVLSRDDIYDYGVEPPVFTRVCRELGITNKNGLYPVTLDQTLELFSNTNALTADLMAKDAEKSHTDDESEVFKIDRLSFSYVEGVDIIKNLDLTFRRCPTAIIGQNGAGKTTLVRLLKGLLKPLSGEIYYGGEDISKKTVAMLAPKVGYVFQNPDDQIFKYTVLEEVMFGLKQIGMDEKTAKENALKALELLNVNGKEEINPYDLELNERKMVAIASVVAMDTDVIILDEPTIAQDYEGRKLIGNMIKELSDKGKFVIAILHDMNFVYENFQRVIVMYKGKILCDGTPDQVFEKTDILDKAKLQKPDIVDLYERLHT